ncbi:hypothetical protein [Vibrio barjaei]|uniref:hypothetical protein n=1 Tax=Vibrio barjaei TaxID=1676683 RepID=UPI002284934D|nr:hypothetical protein [Vibrio barjaei]MCY9874048.1 hypothetical protein [Vibrio barjaei]
MYVLNLTNRENLTVQEKFQEIVEISTRSLKVKIASLMNFETPPCSEELVCRAKILAKHALQEISRHKCAEAIQITDGKHEFIVCDDFEDALRSLRDDDWRVLVDGPTYLVGQVEVELRNLGLKSVHGFYSENGEDTNVEFVGV